MKSFISFLAFAVDCSNIHVPIVFIDRGIPSLNVSILSQGDESHYTLPITLGSHTLIPGANPGLQFWRINLTSTTQISAVGRYTLAENFAQIALGYGIGSQSTAIIKNGTHEAFLIYDASQDHFDSFCIENSIASIEMTLQTTASAMFSLGHYSMESIRSDFELFDDSNSGKIFRPSRAMAEQVAARLIGSGAIRGREFSFTNCTNIPVNMSILISFADTDVLVTPQDYIVHDTSAHCCTFDVGENDAMLNPLLLPNVNVRVRNAMESSYAIEICDSNI